MLYIYLINTQYTKNTCFRYYLCWTQHWEDNCPRQLSETFWQLLVFLLLCLISCPFKNPQGWVHPPLCMCHTSRIDVLSTTLDQLGSLATWIDFHNSCRSARTTGHAGCCCMGDVKWLCRKIPIKYQTSL